MTYQQERDMRLYEQSLMAVDNARFAIIKQGEIVSALGNISSVLSLRLRGYMEPSSKDSTPPPTNVPS